ncbi:hypothetical protein COCC4DRAFT_32798, partial [Bipolaris maydis ATCC 48331]
MKRLQKVPQKVPRRLKKSHANVPLPSTSSSKTSRNSRANSQPKSLNALRCV